MKKSKGLEMSYSCFLRAKTTNVFTYWSWLFTKNLLFIVLEVINRIGISRAFFDSLIRACRQTKNNNQCKHAGIFTIGEKSKIN